MRLYLKRVLLLLLLFTFSHFLHAQLNTLGAAQKTLSSAQDVVAQTQSYVSKIDNAVDYVKNTNAYKAFVDGKEFTFPQGVLPVSADKNYALVINKVFMTPDGMYAEVFMKIPISSDKQLYFLADKVPYSRSGGFAGDLRLYLLKTDSLKVGKGYNIQFDGLETGGTDKSCFVTFTCKGFKDATLTGAVNFDKQTIVTDQDTKQRVSLTYYIQADKLSNFVVNFNQIPTFEFTNLPGFKCSIPSFTLDHSELQNAPGFTLPAWYKDSIAAISASAGGAVQADQVDGVAWQGIYIPSITIDIPKSFKEKDPNQVVVIQSTNLIIDDNGITALTKASGTGTTPFYNGTIKSWEYRIDSLRLNLIASSLSCAGIYGGITLPICKEESQVDFGLLLTKNIADSDIRYSGYVAISRDGGLLDVQAFGLARLKILDATINFNYYNKQFSPSVVLDGSLTLTPKKASDDANAKPTASFGLDFSGLLITTKSPYIDIQKGGYVKMSSTGQMMSNFPVSIDSVSLIKDAGGQRLGLKISLTVQFQKSGSSGGNSSGSGGDGFGGSATFTIWTKRDAASGKWQYDDFFLDKIVIDVHNDAFDLYGELSNFRGDSAYGTGFCGYISLTIMKGKLKIEVAGIFGRYGPEAVADLDAPPPVIQDGDASYRYWFVDAGITLPVIPVGPFVGINGFTGGLYHHMKMQSPTAPPPNSTVECKTTSGLTYLPNYTVHLGLLAGIGLQSVPTDAVFNGKINLGIEFGEDGGILTFSFFGEVAILTPPVKAPAVGEMKDKMQPDKLDGLSSSANQQAIKAEKPSDETGSVRVKWFTQYDFPAETFIGDFDVYVNVLGVVQGGGADYKAAHIAVLFSPQAKYVYMGIPSDPASIEVLDLFKCQAYFCAGNKLPSPPIMPLPPEFGPAPIDYNAMETGAGLSFGVRVSLDGGFDGHANFLGCSVDPYAKIWVAAGFDILITQTTQPVYCSGAERGVNNWYATGQAFIMGGINVGCKYDCSIPLIGKGDFTLVEATISAYVFAQLPKPSYMVGEVTISFKLIEIISGSATIKVKFGDECNPASVDKNIVFIESMEPATGSTSVDVTENIIVNFVKPIENFQFSLPDENDGSKTVQYRGSVGSSDIDVRANGKVIPCTMKWNDDKTKLTLTPTITFPENTKITVIATVQLQYQNGGTWSPSGKIERDTIVFTTKLEPYNIPVANVQYAYPMPGMENYYKTESNSGYIRLLTMPRKPMQITSDYTYQVVFLDSGNEVARATSVTVNNNSGQDNFTYTIPNSLLQNNKSYTVHLTKVYTTAQKRSIAVKEDTTKTIGTYAATPQDTVILEYDFKTSKFSSFSEKVAYYNQSELQASGTNIVHTLEPNQKDIDANTAEGFSGLETYGLTVEEVKMSDKLVRSLGADLTQNFNISSVSNFPDSVSYSYYSDKLLIQYNVFSELEAANQKNSSAAIQCVAQQQQNNCSAGSNAPSVFPKGSTYYYKLGYFLPGKEIKTSEVVLGFTLQSDITVQ
jgi:hypothetical protein